jgi:hypothetical protein
MIKSEFFALSLKIKKKWKKTAKASKAKEAQ